MLNAGRSPEGLRPTRRFSDRVADYVRSRPDYPAAAIDFIVKQTRLAPDATVVDVGSGTGLLSRPFLERGFEVIGVEPNGAMREAGARELADLPGFRSVGGRAESTGLAAATVDLVTAGQAFHWFDPEPTRHEFARILKPGGHAAIVWNLRRIGDAPFLEDYEGLLRRYAREYETVMRRYARPADLDFLFGPGRWREARFDHEQRLGREALVSRLLSASYTPPEGDPDRAPMLRDLDALFERHAKDGEVRLTYDTMVYLGRVAAES